MEYDNTIKPFMKNSPIVLLSEAEYENVLLKFGSFLYLINNKNINPTFLFISLVKDEKLQSIFLEMSGSNTLTDILQKLLINYPNLIKSKMVRVQSIKIIKNKQRNKKRLEHANQHSKTDIQHAPVNKSKSPKKALHDKKRL